MNAPSPALTASTSQWKIGLFVFLFVLLLGVPQAALLPLIDRDEPRFAEASREMLQSGNIIVPMFNNAPRYAKPPLIYWYQALSYEILGENAFAARLPSLLATAGTAALLFAWGVALGSRSIGTMAAFAYAFCLQTIQQGRVATADALLIFFMTLTAFAGWKVITIQPITIGKRSYFWDLMLTLGFAGGFLAKGPEALLPFFAMLYCARGIRRGLLLELTINFLLGVALVLLWAIPAYIETNGDYWRVGLGSGGVGGHMAVNLQGHGASSFGWYLLGIPLYVLLFWISALPWSPLLVTHRKKLFAAWKLDLTDTYLSLNAGLIFLVFSLMVTKLPHYTLPAFPFIALLFARRWIATDLSPRLPTQLCLALGTIFAVLTAIFVPVLLLNHATPSPVGELVGKAQLEGTLAPDTAFALVDFREPNAVWEMRRAVKGYGQLISEAEVRAFLMQPGPHAVVLSSAAWHRLDLTLSYDDLPVKSYEARGWNTAKGWDSKKGTLAFIDLVLVVKK